MKTLIPLIILSLFLTACSQEDKVLEVEEEKITEIIQEEVIIEEKVIQEFEEKKEIEVEKTKVSFEAKELIDYNNCIMDKQKFEVLKENTDIFNYDDFCIKKYELTGSIKLGEPDEIVVRSCGKNNPYTLQQFKKGDENFVYNISKNNGNLCEDYEFSYFLEGEKLGSQDYFLEKNDSLEYVFDGGELINIKGNLKFKIVDKYIIHEYYDSKWGGYIFIYDLEKNIIISDNLDFYNSIDILDNYKDKINENDLLEIQKLLEKGYKLNYIIDSDEKSTLKQIVNNLNREGGRTELEYSLERVLNNNYKNGFSKKIDIGSYTYNKINFMYKSDTILGLFSQDTSSFYKENDLTIHQTHFMPLDHFYYDYRVYNETELIKNGINIQENIFEYKVNYNNHIELFPILTYSSGANNIFFNPENGYTYLWEEKNVKLIFNDLLYPTEERYFGLSIYIDDIKLENISYYGDKFPEYIDTKNIVFDKNHSNIRDYKGDIYFHDGNYIYCLGLRGLIKKENLYVNKFEEYDFSMSKDCILPFEE